MSLDTSCERFDIEESLGFLMSKAHQAFSSNFKARLAYFNITPPQFATLAFLCKQDGMNQIQLGNKMQVDRTTISGIIDRLEKEDFVTRQNNPSDRRTHLVFLTPKGRELKNRIQTSAISANSETLAVLTSEEVRQLKTYLKKIVEGVSYHESDEK